MSGQIVALKLRPYLKDYFIKKLGNEPIRMTTKTKLFPLLSQYLTHKPKNWKQPKADRETLLFELPYNEVINVRSLNYINPRYFGEIQTYFYGIFYNDFIKTVNKMHVHEGYQIKHAILRFMNDNDIIMLNDSYQTLVKIYYRYRNPSKRKKKMKKTANF